MLNWIYALVQELQVLARGFAHLSKAEPAKRTGVAPFAEAHRGCSAAKHEAQTPRCSAGLAALGGLNVKINVVAGCMRAGHVAQRPDFFFAELSLGTRHHALL